MTAQACTRYPCDFAYRGRAHDPGRACWVSGGSGDYDDKTETWGWSVGGAADDDSEWKVALRVGEEVLWVDADEAVRLIEGLVNTMHRVHKANREEDRATTRGAG